VRRTELTSADRQVADGPATSVNSASTSVTSASVRQLSVATQRLAATIAATERLAEGHAEVLRTMDAAVGLKGVRTSDGAGVISLAEAARRTGRHPELLRRWCTEGRIPAVRIGRTWAITQETVGLLVRHRARSRPKLPTPTGR
jgi:excisionase family DNA binding protein